MMDDFPLSLIAGSHAEYLRSYASLPGADFGLVKTAAGLRLALFAAPEWLEHAGFEGEPEAHGEHTLLLCPRSAANAAALRAHLPWLQPRPLGLQTSAGMGDRIGLATPGHVRAARAVGGQITPIFAQQSIREMTRTGRSPQVVMDDATWGIFQEAWRSGIGADADHLKLTDDIDACLSAGFTFFTIDPGAHVDNRAERASSGELRELAGLLPVQVQPDASGLSGRRFEVEGLALYFDEHTLQKAAVKYARAIAHVASMYHYLAGRTAPDSFELEVSVDETDQPTTHAEHLYIASELKRLGVKWVSLAPRFVGTFEKGVDYIGDLAALDADVAGHAAIARYMGPYKLSLHSGSDKFSIYPCLMRHTRGLVHLKTAGTSYLEALRTIAALDVALFREIYEFARQRFDIDKASYHTSAQVANAPQPEAVTDWAALLEQFDAREILHVTFGSVLTSQTPGGDWLFYDRFMDLLRANTEAYTLNVEKHFIRHLQPFCSAL